MEQLRFITVVTTALVDSINPCAIGVLVLLISTLLGLRENKRRMMLVGILYITVIYFTYFAAGIGLLYFIQQFGIADKVGMAVGFIVIFLGFVEIKDFFWYGKGFSLSIPEFGVKSIKERVKKATVPGVIVLGFLVAAVELPCTGGPYLAITALLAQDGLNMLALGYLAIYNFIFVLPLLVILGLVYWGTKVTDLDRWKNANKRFMRLATGLLLVALGILLVLFANGTLSL